MGIPREGCGNPSLHCRSAGGFKGRCHFKAAILPRTNTLAYWMISMPNAIYSYISHTGGLLTLNQCKNNKQVNKNNQEKTVAQGQKITKWKINFWQHLADCNGPLPAKEEKKVSGAAGVVLRFVLKWHFWNAVLSMAEPCQRNSPRDWRPLFTHTQQQRRRKESAPANAQTMRCWAEAEGSLTNKTGDQKWITHQRPKPRQGEGKRTSSCALKWIELLQQTTQPYKHIIHSGVQESFISVADIGRWQYYYFSPRSLFHW